MCEFRDSCDRRYKIFAVSQRRLLDFLNQSSQTPFKYTFCIPKAMNLPEGYRIKAIFSDEKQQNFLFMICHPSWPIIPDENEKSGVRPEEITIDWRSIMVTGIECT